MNCQRLTRHPKVMSAAVVAQANRNKQLAAYVGTDGGTGLRSSELREL